MKLFSWADETFMKVIGEISLLKFARITNSLGFFLVSQLSNDQFVNHKVAIKVSGTRSI